jgi:hypothetical protein
MSIHAVFKKSVLPGLFMVAIMLSLFSAANRVHAASEDNLALNPFGTSFPDVSASYTCPGDSVWKTLDGIFSYSDAEHGRWTNYGSPNGTDWLAIDFGSAKTFNQIKLFLYNDGGGVQPPASYLVQYWDGASWADVTNQTNNPGTPAAAVNSTATPENTLNTVDFDTVTSQKLRVVFTNGGANVGVVELEVYLHASAADESAASAVMTEIEQLPVQTAVTLSHKSAVEAARTAYENLTALQKSLVTNLSKLTAAETAIADLEASLTDLAVQSAFSNAAGNAVTLKLSSALDLTYSLQADHFQITANGELVTVTNAVYDAADSGGQTIKLTFSSPVLLNEAPVTLSIQSGAFKTSHNEVNNAIHSIPVIPFKKLDLSQDDLIGVDDVVLMIVNPAWQIDVNQDGVFNREDMMRIMDQISTHFGIPGELS